MKLPELKLPEKNVIAKVINRSVVLPPYYEKLDELPFDPYESECSVAYGAYTSNALCALVLTPSALFVISPTGPSTCGTVPSVYLDEYALFSVMVSVTVLPVPAFLLS